MNIFSKSILMVACSVAAVASSGIAYAGTVLAPTVKKFAQPHAASKKLAAKNCNRCYAKRLGKTPISVSYEKRACKSGTCIKSRRVIQALHKTKPAVAKALAARKAGCKKGVCKASCKAIAKKVPAKKVVPVAPKPVTPVVAPVAPKAEEPKVSAPALEPSSPVLAPEIEPAPAASAPVAPKKADEPKVDELDQMLADAGIFFGNPVASAPVAPVAPKVEEPKATAPVIAPVVPAPAAPVAPKVEEPKATAPVIAPVVPAPAAPVAPKVEEPKATAPVIAPVVTAPVAPVAPKVEEPKTDFGSFNSDMDLDEMLAKAGVLKS